MIEPAGDLTAHLTPSQEPSKKDQESTEKAEIARGRTEKYRGCPLQKVEIFFIDFLDSLEKIIFRPWKKNLDFRIFINGQMAKCRQILFSRGSGMAEK